MIITFVLLWVLAIVIVVFVKDEVKVECNWQEMAMLYFLFRIFK
jgi:hypothetical protein